MIKFLKFKINIKWEIYKILSNITYKFFIKIKKIQIFFIIILYYNYLNNFNTLYKIIQLLYTNKIDSYKNIKIKF